MRLSNSICPPPIETADGGGGGGLRDAYREAVLCRHWVTFPIELSVDVSSNFKLY
jgi:hypothetical protein